MAQGRTIAQEGGFPAKDPFYFGAPSGETFDKDGWLFALLAFGLHQQAGLQALGALRGFLLLTCFAGMLACGFRRRARPFSSAACSLWALVSIMPFSACSGALAGLAMLSASLWLMEGNFWDSFFGRWVWLPVLLVLWVNLQAAGFWLLPLAAAWAFYERQSPGPAPQFPMLAILSTLAVLAFCAFLHPALWRTPLLALPGPLATPFEAASFPASRGGLALLAATLLAYLACVALPQGREHAGRDAALLGGFLAAALLWKASLPYACVALAPMGAARADIVVDAMPAALRNLRWLVKTAALGCALFILPGLFAAPSPRQAQAFQPRETVQFFKDELLDGKVACEQDWSGRLLWELSPSLKAYDLELDRPIPTEADYAWLRINSPLAKSLSLSRDWQPLDFDDASVLYARADAAHASLIKTWAPRGLRPGDLDEPFESSRLPQVEADLEGRRLNRPHSGILMFFEARLAMEKGQDTLARQWLEQGIHADPNFAPNYRLLGELRAKEKDTKGAQEFFDRAAALGGM
jgi:hypothetical protein